ncbi:hypothetical protein ACIOC1_01495 [Streptomyces sp. NPDC088197]|uniref:nSTAND1 domain-containing NTPase n=1 Tax=Streptomyces sp. NPDC088197 TaxID=3365840 RepID=UPI00381CAC63
MAPGDDPVRQLARELRDLREAAGKPTYRTMARGAGFGASTLSRAASGETLATLPVVLAYVRACGGDPADWERRWRAAATRAAGPRDAEDGDDPAPYRGLARFEAGDADIFFGRDRLTDRLLELTARRRFTAVFGPSGSGKSSLLRAGLIPRLQQVADPATRPAALRILTPGAHPLRDHAPHLTPAASSTYDPAASTAGIPAPGPAGGRATGTSADPEGGPATASAASAATDSTDGRAAAPGPGPAPRGVTDSKGGRAAESVSGSDRGPAGGRATGTSAGPERGPEGGPADGHASGPATASAASAATDSTDGRAAGHASGPEPGVAGGPATGHVIGSEPTPEGGRPAGHASGPASGLAGGRATGTAGSAAGYAADAGSGSSGGTAAGHVTGSESGPEGAGAAGSTAGTAIGATGGRGAGPGLGPVGGRGVGAGSGAEGGGGDTWLIVDQFEELFTLCADAAEREGFIERLLAAAHPAGRTRVVIAVRADFLGRCAEHPRLIGALQDATLLAGPMDRDELREAVVRPAQAAGLIVERALSARVVAEVVGEPGGLPLMSHALLETWRRRAGRALTERAYDEAGGLHGAISRTAEDLYHRLTAEQAALARRVLLRLVMPGDGTPDTRRPVARAELALGADDTAVVLDELARARLITVDDGTVDLAHEALIQAWPRLRSWIDAERTRLRVHRRLTDAAVMWHELDREPGALYRGSRLAAAEEAFPAAEADGGPDELTPTERAFLDASTAARRREEQAAARTTRRLRALTATLSVLLVLAVAAGATAWTQSRSNERQRRAADAARQVALSRQLATTSDALVGSDPELASLLAVQAYRESPTTEAVVSLEAAAALPLKAVLRPPDREHDVESLAFSPDGRTLATGDSAGTVIQWDAAGGRVRSTVGHPSAGATALAYGADGRTLAITGWKGELDLRPVSAEGGRAARTVALGTEPPLDWELGPDARTAVTADRGGAIRLWDVATGRDRRIVTSREKIPGPMAFCAGGRVVAMSDAGRIREWDTRTGRPLADFAARSQTHEVPDDGGDFLDLACGPDGRSVATGDFADGKVRIRDAATGRVRAVLSGHAGQVGALAFSPDGRTLATGGDDRTVRIWDVATGRARAVLSGHTGTVRALAFSPDGRTLATAGADRTVRLWDVTNGPAVLPGVAAAAFGGGGVVLAGTDGGLRLRDTATGHVRVLAGPSPGPPPVAVAVTKDGRAVASWDGDGSVRLWDTVSGQVTATLAAVGNAGGLAFSPDGRTLVIADYDGRLRPWDVRAHRFRTTFRVWIAPGTGPVFGPDGRIVAAQTVDGAVALVDLGTGETRSILNGAPVHGSSGSMPMVDSGVALSSDGRTAAVGTWDGHVLLADLTTGRTRALATGRTAPVTSVAFTPDRRTVAAGDWDGPVHLLDVATGHVRATLTAAPRSATDLAFGPDAHTLLVLDPQQTVRLWAVDLPDPAAAVTAVCRAVGRDLTRQERGTYLPDEPARPVCGTTTDR